MAQVGVEKSLEPVLSRDFPRASRTFDPHHRVEKYAEGAPLGEWVAMYEAADHGSPLTYRDVADEWYRLPDRVTAAHDGWV